MNPRRQSREVPPLPPLVPVDQMSTEELQLAVMSLRESLIAERFKSLRAQEQRDLAVAELRDGMARVEYVTQVQSTFAYRAVRMMCLPFTAAKRAARRLKAIV
jgi:hypothetical protein